MRGGLIGSATQAFSISNFGFFKTSLALQRSSQHKPGFWCIQTLRQCPLSCGFGICMLSEVTQHAGHVVLGDAALRRDKDCTPVGSERVLSTTSGLKGSSQSAQHA